MTTLFKMMIDRYNAVAYTHHYIWGFQFHGVIYMAHTDADMMPYICKLDKASRGAGYALRFCPKTEQKIALLPYATALCSAEYFEEVKTSKQSRLLISTTTGKCSKSWSLNTTASSGQKTMYLSQKMVT